MFCFGYVKFLEFCGYLGCYVELEVKCGSLKLRWEVEVGDNFIYSIKMI